MTHRNPLNMLRCASCGTWWALQPYACKTCGSDTLDGASSQGYGIVRARTQVARAPDDAWRKLAPYVIVMVRLQEGPTVMGHANDDVQVGDRVHGVQTRVAHKDLLKFTKEVAPS